MNWMWCALALVVVSLLVGLTMMYAAKRGDRRPWE
jgi:CHASE1-domain containing sensor protein